MDENLTENVDETHFIINVDNGMTLDFRGDNDVKYADVVSGGIGMTMVVRLTAGPEAIICAPFMIFQNDVCTVTRYAVFLMTCQEFLIELQTGIHDQ